MNFLKNIKNWKTFPSIETLGYFHPLGNYIYLNEYKDDDDFAKSAKNPSLDRNRFSVFLHEHQHYLDHVSTLWGIKKIYKIYRAFDSAIMPNEYEFYKFKELELNLKRDYFLDYYTETYNSITGNYTNRWRFQITSGLRFDHNGKVEKDWPIPFISFASNDKEKISRVPISVVSLLETTATFAEYQFQMAEIIKLEEPHRANQIKAISAKLEKKLYHPELTLYSSAVHITSVNLKIDDPIIAYKISSNFAKIALNIPSNMFSTIKVPSEFTSDKLWDDRSKKMLKNMDRGFAFYLLIRNYYETYGVLQDSKIDIAKILLASSLPNEKKIELEISKEIEKLDYDTLAERNNFSRMIIDKVFYGSQFRKQTGIAQQKDKTVFKEKMRDNLNLIFNSTYFDYEDLELQPIIDKSMRQLDLTREEWFRLYTHCESRIDTFNEICGI